MTKLAEALTGIKNNTLTAVNLACGYIGDAGAIALASALATNNTLITICLFYNKIGDAGATALANALEKNNTLTTVNLDHNNIGATGATALANALEKNNTLTTVNLDHNNIGDAGVTALANALEKNNTIATLNLSSNKIGATGATALANALEKNNTLTTVNLDHNNIGDASATALANTLETNNTLTTVSLVNNKIGDAGATALANALGKNNTLTTVKFHINHIGDAGATALANALEKNNTIATLSLNSNKIGATGATALANALEKNNTLTTVNLNDNNIGATGATALANTLETNNILITVYLARNNIGDAGATALANALEKNNTLTAIHFFQNNIGDAGAKALANALETNSSLTFVELGYNKIGATGATALAKALEMNNTLTSINLAANNVSDAGTKALASTLPENNALASIDLSNNKIGDTGAKALANTLAKNNFLTTVNLARNNFSDAGTKALASTLAENNALTSIDLSANKIGDAGAKALANTLAKNNFLTTVNLARNNFSDAGTKALASTLAENNALTSIDLSANKIGDAGAKALANTLAKNNFLITAKLNCNNISDAGTKALANTLAKNNTLTSINLSINKIGDAGKKALANALETNNTLTYISLTNRNTIKMNKHLRDNKQLAQQLMQACKQKNTDEAIRLLKKGISPHTKEENDKTGNTFLHKAVQLNDTRLMQYLHTQPVTWNVKNKEGKTPKDLERELIRAQEEKRRRKQQWTRSMQQQTERLREAEQVFKQGDLNIALYLFNSVITQANLLEKKAETAEKKLLNNLLQSAQSLWLSTQFMLSIDSNEALGHALLTKCFERTTSVTDFRLTYSLALVEYDENKDNQAAIQTLIHNKLTWLAEERIIDVESLALFKIAIKHVYKKGLINQYQKNVLKGKAQSQSIFSDPRFKALSAQVHDLQVQFHTAAKTFSNQLGALGKQVLINRDNLLHVTDAVTTNSQNIHRIADKQKQLQSAMVRQAKRRMQFGIMKMGLSFIGFFGVDAIANTIDLSELSGIGGFLLNKDPNDVEKLLSTGQSTLSDSFKISHMNPVAETAIKKGGYDPEEFVKQWYSTAIALEKKPTIVANPEVSEISPFFAVSTPTNDTNAPRSATNPSSRFGCFSEVPTRTDHEIAAKTGSKALPLPKKPLGHVTVLYAYTATASDQLSVNANEKLTLIEKDPSGWWTCRRGREQGLVPSTYLEESIVSSKVLPLPAAPGHR